ncbi:MAG: OsmC family protein, partial [Anaerolineae bacterium]|nr:OsmC family protein [Anaerolineae bacterium]
MPDKPTNAGMSYAVTVTRRDERQAVAAARGHELTLNIKKGDGTAGFNAAETLLAALGACMLTNVNAIAAKMRLQITDAQMNFTAVRQDEPPILTEIRYELVLD